MALTGLQAKEITLKEKDYNRNYWCDMLLDRYEQFINSKESKTITLPTYTCKVLCMVGLIEKKQIDFREKSINLPADDMPRTNNEKLIYDTFQMLHDSDAHLVTYLDRFRNEFKI